MEGRSGQGTRDALRDGPEPIRQLAESCEA